MFILITIIFYIIFYYLADIRNKENFINHRKIKKAKKNIIKEESLDPINNNIIKEESLDPVNNNIIKEESRTPINNYYMLGEEEESHLPIDNYYMLEEEESLPPINNYYMLEAEEESTSPINNYYIIEEESNISGDTIKSTTNIQQPLQNIIPEEESSLNNYVKPDLNKILLNNPIPNGTAYSPLNINISYNAQNSNNELDNNKTVSENKENSCMKNQNNNQNKNLGDYNDTTRIHNNSDWVYGNNAWTNNPDYYIPRKVPQPLNQLMNTKKNKENTVFPLMVNTPWTEYKSGDSEPEPYNL